jgi:transposase
VERSEAEAIYDAGRGVVVEVLLRMDRQIQLLSARVDRLERELRKNSRNSSSPPSSDRPGKGPSKREKGPSPRSQGAQPGHEGKGRELLPSWAVDEIVEHWPTACGCGHVFCDADRVAVRPPPRHQVEELPRITTLVTEHQCQHVLCPGCGAQRTGQPPAGVAGSVFGPRLQAAVATLAVRNRVSRRDTVELMRELFGARISTGSVDQVLARAGYALRLPQMELMRALRRAGRVNVDETGWRRQGQRRTLWGAFTDRVAVYRIAGDRHEDRARELLDGNHGIITTDRWWAYNHLPLARRQICWSHLQRDFQAHAECGGAEKELGEIGLRICDELFHSWEIYQHTRERKELRRRVRLLRRELKPILRTYSGKNPRYKRTRGLARNLLKVWPALWTFAEKRGVQPTNNHAERGLRGAVIYRKLSLGSQSENGERRIERLLSASTTCRLQHRSLFEYLDQLLTAHSRGDPLPRLA